MSTRPRRGPVGAGRIRAGGVVVTVGVLLAGCGTGADRSQVRSVAARFYTAMHAHHADQACRQLSSALRQALLQEHSAERCADAVANVTPRRSAVAGVHVYATSARVDLAGGVSVFLGLMRDGWRIDALGRRPRSSGSYDCEEQG